MTRRSAVWGALTVYHPPHALVSGNEFVGAGRALEAPVDTLRFVEEPESMLPPGELQW